MQILRKETDEDHALRASEIITILEEKYDMILMDVPPINIVSDPLALSNKAAGALFVVRQDFSDHREIRRALVSAEMTGLEVLGFVFYGEKIYQGRYYSKRAQKGYQYYNKYDTRIQASNKRLSQNDNRKQESRNNNRGNR